MITNPSNRATSCNHSPLFFHPAMLSFQDLTAIVSEEASSGIQLPTGGRSHMGRNLEVLGLLASLSEQLGHACFTSTRHILQFAQVSSSVLLQYSLLMCAICCVGPTTTRTFHQKVLVYFLCSQKSSLVSTLPLSGVN